MENENNAGKGLFEQLKDLFESQEYNPHKIEWPPMSLETMEAFNKCLAEWIDEQNKNNQQQHGGIRIKSRRIGYAAESELHSELYSIRFKKSHESAYDGNKLDINRIDWDLYEFWRRDSATVPDVWNRIKNTLDTNPPIGKVFMMTTLEDDRGYNDAIQAGIDMWKDDQKDKQDTYFTLPSHRIPNRGKSLFELSLMIHSNRNSAILSATEEDAIKMTERVKAAIREYPNPLFIVPAELKDDQPFYKKTGNKKGGKKNRKGGRKF